MQRLGILSKVLINVISETFPKELFLKRYTKEAMSSYFLERYVLNLLSAKIRQKNYA